jgi:thiol:disulfide interchange protein DsbA
MKAFNRRKFLSLAGLAVVAGSARGAEREPWLEGRHYFKLGDSARPARRPAVARITEIFSYGCPGCDAFLPHMQGLERKLPADVEVEYLPASWIAAENWPLFQRTYLTAKALGVAQKAHAAMFAAVWRTGELAVLDPRTKRPTSPLPSVRDVARFYQRVAAVPVEKFVETATSFAVDSAMRLADAQIKAFRPDSTPTLIINDSYRVDLRSAGGAGQLVDAALSLVRKPSRAA